MMRRCFVRSVSVAVTVLTCATFVAIVGQAPVASPKTEQRPITSPPRTPAPIAVRRQQPLETTDRSIAVDSKVNIKFCVSDGVVKINGWDRDEVRLFVNHGRRVDINVLERNTSNDKPNWIWLRNAAASVRADGPFSNCLAGRSVELDVPVGASLNFEARTSGAEIDTVQNVSVKVIEGSISIRNIPGGVKAETFQGDVTLENSCGEINLRTTTGNILAYDVSPGGIGDILTAKTSSGSISLQRVQHRQINANTISGSVLFNGGLLSGGIYTLKTSSGSIQMQLPENTSGTFVASLGFGTFKSALPINIETENPVPGGKSIVAKMGLGTATVNLTTLNGRIMIQRQEK